MFINFKGFLEIEMSLKEIRWILENVLGSYLFLERGVLVGFFIGLFCKIELGVVSLC